MNRNCLLRKVLWESSLPRGRKFNLMKLASSPTKKDFRIGGVHLAS